jgi:DUF1680 family protein
MPAVKGESYQAEVPDTLDLAERARYAINVLTRAVVPQRAYAVWQGMNIDANPPHFAWPNWLTYKWVEALPRMREMCGEDLNLDVELAMMQALVDRIGKQGLLYYPSISPDQPPNTAYPVGCGRMILAMAAWYERDGDPEWLSLIADMAHGLGEIAIRRYDYAYYPLESGYSPDGTWAFTQRGGGRAEYFPYTPPDEPSREQQGHEGTVKFDIGTPIRGLVKAYQLTGDESVLDTARQLAAFCRLPAMWEDGWQWNIAGHQHGLFAGHFHGNVMALRGLLDLAVASGDETLKTIVHEAYEHACTTGVRRAGWFPGWITPERFGRLDDLAGWVKAVCEGCSLGDMVGLAVALSDAGVGDYWDDVDSCVRNQLVEQQLVDKDRMALAADDARIHKPKQDVPDLAAFDAELAAVRPDLGAIDDVIERSLGGFGFGSLTDLSPVAAYGCCTGNAALGLYYAWEATVRHRAGMATINLLLNRTSPWLDIDSYLPYEGRVRIHNKTASSIAVRIPGWAAIEQVAVTLDGLAASPLQLGRYLLLPGTKPGQQIELRFAIPVETTEYIVNGRRHKLTLCGSTVVDVSPRADEAGGYPIYMRAHMQHDAASLKRVRRFVAA